MDDIDTNTASQITGLETAVIGMAGRFPGARNISEFWEKRIINTRGDTLTL